MKDNVAFRIALEMDNACNLMVEAWQRQLRDENVKKAIEKDVRASSHRLADVYWMAWDDHAGQRNVPRAFGMAGTWLLSMPIFSRVLVSAQVNAGPSVGLGNPWPQAKKLAQAASRAGWPRSFLGAHQGLLEAADRKDLLDTTAHYLALIQITIDYIAEHVLDYPWDDDGGLLEEVRPPSHPDTPRRTTLDLLGLHGEPEPNP